MNVVLVHGAWADGSSWSGVIEALHARGHQVDAVQLPMTSLGADIDTTRRAIEKIGATVVVGHSYGGFVMTAAAADMPTVQSLVFVAAYAPTHGETVASISHAAAQMPGGRAIIYGDDGWTSVDPDQFGSALGADLSLDTQRILAAVQGPTHVSCLITAIDTESLRRVNRRSNPRPGTSARVRGTHRRSCHRGPRQPPGSTVAPHHRRRRHRSDHERRRPLDMTTSRTADSLQKGAPS
jgi:pimeloyl-ACP methyl ester carboxylesterase